MSVDDITKLMLVSAAVFAIVGIAYQIMRLIGKLADVVQDARKSVQNLSSFSDMLLSDYQAIHDLLGDVRQIFAALRLNIITPIKTLLRIADKQNKEEVNKQQQA